MQDYTEPKNKEKEINSVLPLTIKSFLFTLY